MNPKTALLLFGANILRCHIFHSCGRPKYIMIYRNHLEDLEKPSHPKEDDFLQLFALRGTFCALFSGGIEMYPPPVLLADENVKLPCYSLQELTE